jgi:acetyl esterase
MTLRPIYKLHPDYKYMHLIPRFNLSSPWALKVFSKFWGLAMGSYKFSPKVRTEKVVIPSAEDGFSIPALVIRPKDGITDKKLPCLVLYHGGAFYLPAIRFQYKLAEIYATAVNCAVVFPDYRLSLDNPFPAGFHDCYATLLWAEKNADELGIDASKIVVGGDSAGGCLAAAVALKARDAKGPKLCGQMLIYPVIDYQCKTDSANQFVKSTLWNAVANRIMWDVYLKNTGGLKDTDTVSPYASPVAAKDLSGLPPAYVDVAEFDPLRDEGLQYAAELKRCGVAVTLADTKGTFHGYDALLSAQPAKEALSRKIAALNLFFK